jgi:serine/threonine protein kinase
VKGWAELKDAFFAAVEGDAAERARQVAALAAIDPALSRRLETLLAADDRGETLPLLLELEPGRTELPSRIGAYDVVDVLGVGGMGEVYRARDARLQREVAIKVLPTALTHDRERLARFAREAQVLASLNHPNIAQVYGLEESGGAPALVMELVPGSTLAAVIAGGAASLTLPRVLGIARQIADGLDAAHEKGIVHRDLKPANVVLTPDGQVKILDFGVAKSLDPGVATGPAAGTTGAGVVLGDARLHEPGAGARVGRRQAHRRLGAWLSPVRVADRTAGVCGRYRVGQPGRGSRTATRPDASARRHAGWSAVAAAPLSREGPEAPAARYRGRTSGARRGVESTGR